MDINKTCNTKSEECSASLYLARLCRVIACGLMELEKIRNTKFAHEILYELAICFAKLGLDKEAIDTLQTVLSIQPDHVESHRKMGFLYLYLGQNEKAINSYNEVLRLCPDDVDALCSLGDCYIGLRLYGKAVEAFKQALQLSPKDIGIHVSLAAALYMEMRKIGPAIKKYNEFAGKYKVPAKIILPDIRTICGTEEIPGMMENIRKEGLKHDNGKI